MAHCACALSRECFHARALRIREPGFAFALFRSTRTVVEPLYKNRDLSDIDVEVRFIQPDGSESEATVYPLHTLLLK